MGQTIPELCDNCEYGRRFLDLGQCPECSKGRIVGDTHTRRIFCSELHGITAVAIDFYGKKNCDPLILQQEYCIRICQPISAEHLNAAAHFLGISRSQMYLAAKSGTPIKCNASFTELISAGAELVKNGVAFQTEPPLPMLWRLADCFPALAEDYSQIVNAMVLKDSPEGEHHEQK